MKPPSPLLGFNNNVRHKGRVFHIQTEDSGVRHPHIITHLFADGGRILKTTKTSYAEFIDTANMGEVVRQMMQDQHKAMFMALRDGQFDHLVEDLPPARGSQTGARQGAVSGPVTSGAVATPPAGVAPATAAAPATSAAPAAPTLPARAAVAPPPGPAAAPTLVAKSPEPAPAPARPPADQAPLELPSLGPAPAPSPPPPAPARTPAPPAGSPPARPLASAPTQPVVPVLVPPAPAAVVNVVAPPPRAATTQPSAPTHAAPQASATATTRPTPPRMPSARPRLDIDPAAIHRAPAHGDAPGSTLASVVEATVVATPGIDLDTLERAAAEAETPLFQQIRDLPPPPAAVIGPRAAAGPGGYSSVAAPGPVAPPPPSTRGRYAPSRPSSIFASVRPQEGASIFGEDLISEKSLDEVILSYLAEDLDGPGEKK